MIAEVGVKENAAVVTVAFMAEARVMANPVRAPMICGKVPAFVVSMNPPLLKVAALMLANAACAAVGVVNFVTVKETKAPTLKVPAVSFTVNTESANATVHVAPDAGAVTKQGVVPEVSIAMPAPDSVMVIRPA